MKKLTAFVIALLLASSVWAQGLSTVQTVRAKYPTPLGVQHAAFLIEVAKATHAQLLRKDAGSHVTLPNGVNVSQDILMFNGNGVDILSDGEGAAVPTWQEKGPIAGEYIDVSGFGDPPAPPTPTPQPTPSGAATSELQQQQLAALLQVIQLQQQQLDALEAQHAALVKGLAELKAAIAAGVKIRF